MWGSWDELGPCHQLQVGVRTPLISGVGKNPSETHLQSHFIAFIGLRVFCVGNGFFLLRWVGWGVFCDGRCWGFFATVLGFFLRQWNGFWLRQGGFFASVVVFCDGNRGLLHRHRSAAERSIKKTSSWATVRNKRQQSIAANIR